MKKTCIIVFVVLTTIMQVNAQVSNDTTVAVQDTTTKVVNKQNNHKATVKPTRKKTKPTVNTTDKKGKGTENQFTKVANDTVVPQKETPANQENVQTGKPNKNWWQRLWGKSDDNNDCEQCESQLEDVKKKNNELQKQVNDLQTKIDNTKAIMGIDDRDFYRSLITTPLKKKYDSIQVDYYKKTAALFDYENKKEMKWVYDNYYPLLENYGKYNENLAKLIRKVIRRFELPDALNSETEKELFNEGLEMMEYSKKYRWKVSASQEIKYLEDVIKDTQSLFDNSSKFTKENFEEQLRKLGVEYNQNTKSKKYEKRQNN